MKKLKRLKLASLVFSLFFGILAVNTEILADKNADANTGEMAEAIKEIKTPCDKQFAEVDQLIEKIKKTSDPAVKSKLAAEARSVLGGDEILNAAMSGNTVTELKAYFYQAYYEKHLEYTSKVSYYYGIIIQTAKMKLKNKNLSSVEKQDYELLLNESEKAKRQ